MSIAQGATATMPLYSSAPVQPHSAAPSIDQPQHQADLPPQRTREYSCPHLYAEILMSFPEVSGAALGEKTCVAVLHRALQELHGVVGGALPFDVLRVGKQPVAAAAAAPAAAETAAEAVASSSGGSSTNILIKTSKNDMDKLWSACTFMTEYGDKVCRLQVLRVSPFLSSMAADGHAFLVGLHATTGRGA